MFACIRFGLSICLFLTLPSMQIYHFLCFIGFRLLAILGAVGETGVNAWDRLWSRWLCGNTIWRFQIHKSGKFSILPFPKLLTVLVFQELLDPGRWQHLVHQFRQENFKLYQLNSHSVFTVTLQAGLSALKTPYPFLPLGSAQMSNHTRLEGRFLYQESVLWIYIVSLIKWY